MRFCGYPKTSQGGFCGARAERLVAEEANPDKAVPMCGMHGMLYKDADGYINQTLDNAEPIATEET